MLVGASAIGLGGCQSIATERFNDPERANLFVKWGADVQTNLDAKFPRRYKPAANETLESFEKIFGSTISAVNNFSGLAGFYPLDRVLDFENKESWNYDPRNRDDPTKEGFSRKILIHPVKAPLDLLGSVGGIFGSAADTLFHLVNTTAGVPLSPNTRELAELRGDPQQEDYNKYHDSLKYVVDGITDIPMVPLKMGMYAVSESSIIPDGWKRGIENIEEWAGYEIKDKTLEYKFRQEDGTTNGGRVAINCIPFIAGLADQAWRTKYIEEGASLRNVVNSSENYFKTNLNMDTNLGGRVDPSKAIGYIIDENGERRLYPAESSILKVLKSVGLILNASGSSAGGAGGPSGGVTGGGGEGGSTGR
jgi:hypothetical protein